MKRKIIIILTNIIIIGIIVAATICIINEKNKIEQENIEHFSKNISMPDRIIYKNKEKYYEINKQEELYDQIIKEMSKKVDTSKNTTIITELEVDDMHNQESFIEFDYNTISKNYILTLGDNSKFVRLLDSTGELIDSNISDTKSIQSMVDSKIQNKNYYTMQENKEYISQNELQTMPYRYLQQFDNKRKWNISKSH